jgi:hypothetical protein
MANFPTSDPSFPTRSAAQQIQSAHMNAVQAEIVAIGASLRGTAAHDYTTSGNVSAGGGLQVTGGSTFAGQVTASAQPRCLAYSTAALALPANTWTTVNFESEQFDVGGLHSTASNPSRLTIPAGSSGLYLVGATLRFSTGGAGSAIDARFIKNSTTTVTAGMGGVLSSVAAVTLEASAPMVLDGGDYIQAEANPTGSTASLLATNVRNAASELWAVRIW